MDLSERLKLLRQEAGLSQEELADRLGVTRQAVSRWETGKVPNIDNLAALSELYEVTLDELIWDAPKKEKNKPLEEEQAEENICNRYSFIAKRYLIFFALFCAAILIWGKLTHSMAIAKATLVYTAFLLLLGGLIYVLYTLVMYLKRMIKDEKNNEYNQD